MIAFEYLFFVFQIMLEIVLSFDAGKKLNFFLVCHPQQQRNKKFFM